MLPQLRMDATESHFYTFSLLIFLLSYVQCETIVNLNHGSIRGEENTDEHENIFYAFRGIPYAEAPIADLRFKAPVPKQPWDGILDTLKDGPPCPQLSFFTDMTFVGSEDNCLTLNVYTPQLPSTNNQTKLNVVFHIHGGGFAGGSGGETFLYGPKRFMQKDKNVILVSLTYRVSSIGFLSTGDTASPGNYGLLDQLEALKWIRDNINKFGGDPTKVTLLGESAGGASVMYHLLSPLSKGLFHRAIAMSGTPFNLWAFQHEPLYWAKTLARRMKCPETNTTLMVDCLKTEASNNIIMNEETVDNVLKIARPVHFIYGPSVDGVFLPDTPYNIIKNKQYNDVPLLIGVTKDEGNCWYRFTKPPDKLTDEVIDQLVKTLFNGNTNLDQAVKKVKDEYFTSSRKQEDVFNSVAQVVTDGSFHKYHYQTVKMMLEKGSKLYVYSYDYPGNTMAVKLLFNMSSDTELGVCHGFDLSNFFSNNIFGAKLQEGKDWEMKEHMQKLFFNFILNGTPNYKDVKVKWPLAEPDKINVYHINTENSISVYDPSKDNRYRFWTEEIPKTLGYSYQPSTGHSSTLTMKSTLQLFSLITLAFQAMIVF